MQDTQPQSGTWLSQASQARGKGKFQLVSVKQWLVDVHLFPYGWRSALVEARRGMHRVNTEQRPRATLLQQPGNGASSLKKRNGAKSRPRPIPESRFVGAVSTGISSEIRTKLRDWAVLQARACCYSQAAMSSNDSKTLYLTREQMSLWFSVSFCLSVSRSHVSFAPSD